MSEPEVVEGKVDAEIEEIEKRETALAVSQPAGELVIAAEVDSFRQGIAVFKQKRRLLMEFVRENLTPGTDFMTIHQKIQQYDANGFPKKTADGKLHKINCPNRADIGATEKCEHCGAKPTLLQSGAEKISSLLQWTAEFVRDTETWEMLGSVAGYICLKCRLYSRSGQIVGEGRGARAIGTDYGDINKTIKMASKSAMISAVKGVASLSEIFTADMDVEETPATTSAADNLAEKLAKPATTAPSPATDTPPMTSNPAPSEQTAPPPAPDTKPPENVQPGATGAPALISQKQLDLVVKLCKELKTEINAVIKSVLALELSNPNLLTKEQTQKVLGWLFEKKKKSVAPSPEPEPIVHEEIDLDEDPFAKEKEAEAQAGDVPPEG